MFFGIVEPVAVVQRGLDALGRGALRLQRALGEEARAAQRHLEAGRRVFLDELHRAAAGKERADHVDAEPRDLRQQRLEVGLREGQREVGQHLAAALLERLLEAGAAFGARGIVPRHPRRPS